MPEGPEVKRNVDYLNSVLQGTRILNVQINSGRYVKHGPFKGYDVINDDMLVVDEVCCKGKFIYFKFNSGASLWSTLGMSGMWQRKKSKHTRVTLTNHKGQDVYFNDVRNFGTLKYVQTSQELEKKLKTLGPDVLSEPAVGPGLFRQRFLNTSNKTITENLMNQSVISGVGNYLKAEILYACQISPHRLCKDITAEEYGRLYEACFWLPRLSYKMGGATLATYRDADGKSGEFSRRFAVYNQKTDPEGRTVIKENTKDKRTTHWVPEVQK
jgi:formamidopyrimidine-DNA glycosylase